MNFKLINIIGIDGAGKTTLAFKIEEYFNKNNKKLTYRYCQYIPKLLLPLKLFAKFTVMNNTNEFENYEDYKISKNNFNKQFKKTARIYSFVWMIDYIIQTIFKITIPFNLKVNFIVDRYVYDVAINLSITAGKDCAYASKIVNYFLLFSPKPDLTILIDIPEKVAFDRKDDISSYEYLKERRKRYITFANKYNFFIVNGEKSIDHNLKKILSIMK